MIEEERQKMDKKGIGIAYHEAAHAVVTFKLGLKIRKITIVPEGDCLGCCHHYAPFMKGDNLYSPSPATIERVQKQIVILFAGNIAEERFVGREIEGWEDLTDTEKAYQLACSLVGSREELDAFLNWLFIRAKGYINNKVIWEAIDALAIELIKKKELSGKEAFEIYRSALLSSTSKA